MDRPDVDDILKNVLEHHGVKGMHWGVRKDRSGGPKNPAPVSVKQKSSGKIKTTGGKRHGAHEDAIRARTHQQIAKKSTSNALSDKELQALVNRLNMEQSLSRLSASPGQKFISTLLGTQGKQLANQAANDFRTKKVAAALKK